jgi:glycosyltransferase involved in cell wall biosynthesis
MNLSVAIPTYGRDEVLISSLADLLALDPPPWELLVIDQTPRHDEASEAQLAAWDRQGRIRWLRLGQPSITGAMNRALQEAKGERILFLDDDIRPDPQLLQAHQRAGEAQPDAMVAGRVLQPWHGGQVDPEDSPFLFNSLEPRLLTRFMGGNVAIPVARALALGGFDTNFVKVAYHFEAEFAHRWCEGGGLIHYEPGALIHHLRAERGGTRSYGQHLTTLQPDHSVGRYYFQLRTRPLVQALPQVAADLLRSVRTRHHLRRPWWIPATLLAELRGLAWALRLHARGPALLSGRAPRLLVVGSHPVQYHTPLFQRLEADPGLLSDVLYLALPDERTQGLGFGVAFTWDVPLLEGYRWHRARSGRGRGITGGYAGIWLALPLLELGWGPSRLRPDAILLTGWHFLGMLQIHLVAQLLRIPVILRMDSNGSRPRPWILRQIYRLLFHGVAVGLPVGQANARWYQSHGLPAERLVPSPHFIDNGSFAAQAAAQRPQRAQLRQQWQIPPTAFCFLFAGKLQAKKRPFDLLEALARLRREQPQLAAGVHLLVVGSGNQEEACRTTAAAQALPVSFTGFLNQSQMAAAYAVSDCLLLPSDHGETWGLVVNEAMACALPVVVSELVGCREDLVIPGVTGLEHPCGDTAALAACLASMAADPAAAARMGRAGRERVEMGFTIEAAATGIASAARQVLHSRPAATAPPPP